MNVPVALELRDALRKAYIAKRQHPAEKRDAAEYNE